MRVTILSLLAGICAGIAFRTHSAWYVGGTVMIALFVLGPPPE